MRKIQKLSFSINLFLVLTLVLVVGLVLGIVLAEHFRKSSMEAEIENHCECEHCHDGCDHDDCNCDDCHEHLASVMDLSLSPSTTYYKNGSSFYTLNSSTAYYRCSHCSTDFTSSSPSGTCYTTYNSHSCSAQYGSHSMTTSYTYGNHSVSRTTNYTYGRHSVSSSTSYTYGNHNVRSSTTTTYGNHKVGSPPQGHLVQCAYCKEILTWTNNFYEIESQTCSSNKITTTTYSCSYCGKSSSSSFSGKCTSNVTSSTTTYSCSYCGRTSSSSFSGICTSNRTVSGYTYTCSYCGTSSSSSFSGTCYSNVTSSSTYCSRCGSSSSSGTCSSNITGYKCSYCNQTFSSNSTAECSSRPVTHAHSVSYNHTDYSYKNIDTNANTTSTSAYTVATGYTVRFNINNSNATGSGTTGGTTADQYFLHGHSQTLKANGFTFSNHRFAGWVTSGTSTSVAYSNQQALNLTTSTVASGGTYNLYVFWKYQLAKPTATNTSPTYNGSARSPTYSNVDTTYMNAGGDQSATNAGSYTATFSLKDATKTEWADQTTANVSINWSIQPIDISTTAGVTVTIPQIDFVYDGTSKMPEPTVTI